MQICGGGFEWGIFPFLRQKKKDVQDGLGDEKKKLI